MSQIITTMAKKQSSIQIHDARPSKKNPNAKYIVKSVGKNGEPLSQSEALNDIKAVKTHIKAMNELWNLSAFMSKMPDDHTGEGKFTKLGFAVSGLKK